MSARFYGFFLICSSCSYSLSAQNRNIQIQNGDYIQGNKVDQRKYYHTTVRKYYMTLSEKDMEALAQKMALRTSSAKPGNYASVLIIPKVSKGEDIYSLLADANIRIGLSKVTAAFLERGYSIVSFPEKNNVARLKLPRKDISDNDQAIYLSGADICIEVDIIKHSEGDENSVSVILSAYDRNNGLLLSQEEERSNAFRTTDYSLLMDGVIPEAADALITKIKKIKP